MKDHKQKEIFISLWELTDMPLSEVGKYLEEYAEGLIEPKLRITDYGYDGTEASIVGWVPMTEKEKERAKKKAAAEKERKKRQAEELADHELSELRRLAKKHGVALNETA